MLNADEIFRLLIVKQWLLVKVRMKGLTRTCRPTQTKSSHLIGIKQTRASLLTAHACALPRSKRSGFPALERIILYRISVQSQHVGSVNSQLYSAYRLNGSLEEGNPAHRASHLNYLYALYFTACLMERTWRFALPVILSNVAGGYQAVAVLCFVSPVACFIFAPAIGRILDTVDTSYGVWSLLLIQSCSIIFSGCILLHAFEHSLCITSGPIFNVIVTLQMLEKLSAVTSEVAIERDWLTQLCGKENTLGLAHGNSMLRRMDLACDFIGTVSYGWIFDLMGCVGSVIYTTSIAILSTPLLYALIYFRIEGGLCSNPQREVRQDILKKRSKTLHAWNEYFFNNPMLPSSIVIVLLYFNVALSPGGLLTAFLTFKGMNGSSLAIFRGSCALMGFVGSYCGKIMIEKFGLLQSGRYALGGLLATLGVSVAIFYFLFFNMNTKGSLATAPYLFAFVGGIVLSRVGLWVFDMVNTQLFQQHAKGTGPSSIASTEMALCSLSEISMLGVAAFLSVPMDSFFAVLVGSSYSAIILGSLLFVFWSIDFAKKEQGKQGNGIELLP